MSDSEEFLVMTIAEAARFLEISENNFYRVMLSNPKFEVIDGAEGPRVRFPRDWQISNPPWKPRKEKFDVRIEEAAEGLGLSRAEIYALMESKKLKFKDGRPPLISRSCYENLKLKLQQENESRGSAKPT